MKAAIYKMMDGILCNWELLSFPLISMRKSNMTYRVLTIINNNVSRVADELMKIREKEELAALLKEVYTID